MSSPALRGSGTVRRVGPVGRAIRLGVSALLLGVLLVAQLGRHDDWFPLGMLGQYGIARDPQGVVVDSYLVGYLADGAVAEIALRADTVGMTRVELEALLPDLLVDPSPLALLEAAFEAGNPGVDVVALEVRQRIHDLRGGALSGPPQDRLALRWEAP